MRGQNGAKRPERIIVTYDHDYAMYLKKKRTKNLSRAQKIVDNRQAKSRQSQQDPRHYVTTTHKTKNGERAIKIEMAINEDVVTQEEENSTASMPTAHPLTTTPSTYSEYAHSTTR